MKERNEGAADAAAVRSFNLHLSAPRPRPPARPLQRGPSSERRAAPPFAVDRPTCSGACVRGSRQKKSTLGFGKRAMADGRTDEKRARRRAHLPCPSGGVRARLTGPDPEKDAWRRRRSRSIGRRRSVRLSASVGTLCDQTPFSGPIPMVVQAHAFSVDGRQRRCEDATIMWPRNETVEV